jgi:hypothetical protein
LGLGSDENLRLQSRYKFFHLGNPRYYLPFCDLDEIHVVVLVAALEEVVVGECQRARKKARSYEMLVEQTSNAPVR